MRIARAAEPVPENHCKNITQQGFHGRLSIRHLISDFQCPKLESFFIKCPALCISLKKQQIEPSVTKAAERTEEWDDLMMNQV